MTCPSHIGQPPPVPATDMPQFWRSLDEFTGDPAFAERLAEEFPRQASVWDESATDRRQFMQLMAASFALAGAAGCSEKPAEVIVPYVRPPEELVPGVPQYFATAMPTPDGALGLVVTSHQGRPTKVEGNPLHPASLGATDAWAQASVLTLYDPDRSQTVMHAGVISTWGELVAALREAVASTADGGGLHVLSPPVLSPTLSRQREALLAAKTQAVWHEYEPVGRENALAGAELAFGEGRQPVYHFANADVVLSLDADFLTRGPGAVRYARNFMARRGPQQQGEPNRLYVVESTTTPTGAAADHRLPLRPTQVESFARGLAARLNIPGIDGGDVADPDQRRFLEAAAIDLAEHRGRAVVVCGDHQPPAVHALVHAINDAMGAVGATVEYVNPLGGQPRERVAGLRELVDALNAGSVKVLVILDGNPVYDAPADLEFAQAILKAPLAVHFSLYEDETSDLCHWHAPAAHFLESWSDARAYDGTAAIVQPLIAPLYGGKTVHEVVSAVADETPQSSYDLVRATWLQEFGDGAEGAAAETFDERWHAALRDGVIADSQFATVPATLQLDRASLPPPAAKVDGLELVLLPDPTIGDGRFANNGWLQELPKPLTKLTWENAVLVAPTTAKELQLETGDVVRLEAESRSLVGPALVQPGHPAGSLTCHFGYGRTCAGRTGTGLGFSAYALRTFAGGYVARNVRLAKTGERIELARTQKHHEIDGRNIVHRATVADYAADPHGVLPEALHHPLASLIPDIRYEGFAWGMAIDLSKCHGCNACVIACQAENNIPIVGKEQVIRSREMHWLRIDNYYFGEPENSATVHQSMLCQHCEKAPCEVVCPVAATTHSDEGLNEMTYNRCIGTRYCSNNCPYKVRRFNFLEYNGDPTAVLKLLHNPDVTVRSRGVMEKCTYCVQRINHARIDAKKASVDAGELPTIADGTLVPACQQACPSQAIVFGDVNDPNSRVSKLKAEERNFGVLSELGTQPRTSYLVQLRNPNPQLR